jgi:hypothetical protein
MLWPLIPFRRDVSKVGRTACDRARQLSPETPSHSSLSEVAASSA